MRSTLRLLIRGVLATLCIAIGIVGLIMPVLPGWLFFGLAALVLFPDAKFTRKSVDWLERHFPWTRRGLRAVVR